jgi:methionyl-tRNA formyltransferase
MRLAFMGTPDFAARCLERLYSDGHDVAAVFTQPDRPRNRGMKLTSPPVKTVAEGKSPVYQPETLRDGGAERILRGAAPELIAVVAYGRLLPREILDLPPLGCVNIHASLLPKYRGSAPIQRAILCGETETGVTSMYMAEELDAGDIIFTKRTAIGETESSEKLFARLAGMGAELLSETITAIARAEAPRTPQDGGDATFAPPLTRDMAELDWTLTAREVCCRIRGLDPWPVARAVIGGAELKIYAAAPTGGRGEPGRVLAAGEDGIEVACGGGAVLITELQAPGGRRMAARDYLRGHGIAQC